MDPQKEGYQPLNAAPSASAVPSAPVLYPWDMRLANSVYDEPSNPGAQADRPPIARNLTVTTTAVNYPPPQANLVAPQQARQAAATTAHSSRRACLNQAYLRTKLFEGLTVGGLIALTLIITMFIRDDSDVSFSGIVPDNTCFTSSDSLQVFPSANANFYGSGALQLYSVLEPISNNTECQLNFPKQFIQPLSVNGSRNRFELASDEFLANFAKEISLNCSGNPAKIQFSAQAQNSKLETSSMLSSTVQFAKNCTSFFKALRGGSQQALNPAYE